MGQDGRESCLVLFRLKKNGSYLVLSFSHQSTQDLVVTTAKIGSGNGFLILRASWWAFKNDIRMSVPLGHFPPPCLFFFHPCWFFLVPPKCGKLQHCPRSLRNHWWLPPLVGTPSWDATAGGPYSSRHPQLQRCSRHLRESWPMGCCNYSAWRDG